MRSIANRIAYLGVGVMAPLVVAVLAHAAWIGFAHVTGVARTDGAVGGLAVRAPVQILRDERGIPHVRAGSVHDAMFGEGYAVGSDRLFQIDLTRRFVLGRLAEFFGAAVFDADVRSRTLDVRGIVAAQWASMGPAERDVLTAFADGVNAAALREPLPPEYRALFTGFEPWRPQDALVAGFATQLELTDGWDHVIARDAVARAAGAAAAAWYSLSDPAYDAPVGGGTAPAEPPLGPLAAPHPAPPLAALPFGSRDALGSNAWAAGAGRTPSGRALLANDPHLARGVPGIWYLVDLAAPGFHAAGATLAGIPGIVLGHNERLAWGATNGHTAALRVYAERFTGPDATTYLAAGRPVEAAARVETFRIRFGADRTQRYLATRHGFVVESSGTLRHAVQYGALERPRSPLGTFLGLDRAASIDGALAVLAGYAGPAQNFILADTSGRVAYALAGEVPDDPLWALRARDGADAPAPLHAVPFGRLPRVEPARGALVVSANNLPYAAGYPVRLAPWFTPPYRAAEIARRLRAAPAYDVRGFAAIQADTTSLGEAELARRTVAAVRRNHAENDPDLEPALAALTAFDGRFDPASRGATAAQRIRLIATYDLVASHLPAAAARAYFADGPAFATLLRALRERPHGWFPNDDADAFLVHALRDAVAEFGRDAIAVPYGDAYAVVPAHPLAGFGASFWNAPKLAGSGGAYAPAVQELRLGQSFRAVWDVGRWDEGGIDLPVGESGEPGSPHYADQAGPWAAHAVTPLPFGADAVTRSTRASLTLGP